MASCRLVAACVRVPARQLFYSFFKTLKGKTVMVHLKNGVAIQGVLLSVDQYLNVKLDRIGVVDAVQFPHLISLRTCFIRGSGIRYIQLPAEEVDVDILHEATRKELAERAEE